MFTVAQLLNACNNIHGDMVFTIKYEDRVIFHGFEEDIPEELVFGGNYFVLFFEITSENSMEIEVC